MPVSGERLQHTLDGYAKFLQERDLVLPKYKPYLVHWVREFLLLALQSESPFGLIRNHFPPKPLRSNLFLVLCFVSEPLGRNTT